MHKAFDLGVTLFDAVIETGNSNSGISGIETKGSRG
jgi:hypothetical protein